jgi:hypothetical protein
MQRLRIIRQAARARHFSTTPRARTSWSPGPAPPRLPKEEQELFEKLQRESTGAFSTPPSSVSELRARINQSPDSSPTTSTSEGEDGAVDAKVNASGDGGELHPHVRRGARPEFEGDINPKTGEVGGPKNEPLRWGEGGDWSYNGRVTDF